MSESTILLDDPERVLAVFGTRDQNLVAIRDRLHVTITHRDGQIRISGPSEAVSQATEILARIKRRSEHGEPTDVDDVKRLLAEVTGQTEQLEAAPVIDVLDSARRIRPRTPGQARYVDAIRTNDLVLTIGPAGTGKTYLAVAMAVQALKQRSIRKIVLVRPAVEAGESIGFLPGDIQAKINPYLRPLLDALHEMMDYELIKEYMERDVIEVIPMGYMRGRTLNEAFTILDEAQNTTVAQMKMFLTRMGEGSKIVVSGDITQVDLPLHTRSGLTDALQRLRSIPGVRVVELHQSDIVRHPLVQKIVEAYEDKPKRRERQSRR